VDQTDEKRVSGNLAVAGCDSTKGDSMMQMLCPLYDVASRLGKIVTRRAWPLHRHEDIAPFFIVGAGRSGTTLLRRILVASEQVHIPPETYVLSQMIEHYRRNAYLDWPSLVNQCMALFELHPEFHTFQITLRPLLPKLHALPEAERSLARMLDMFYRFHARQTGVKCDRWGDKTPSNVHALDDIYAVFPKARFIHLLRDGVDVVHSCVERGMIPDWRDAATHWRDAIHAFADFEKKQPQTCYVLRYENMVKKPEAEIQYVCSFLDIAYSRRMIDRRDHIENMGDMAYQHYASTLEAVSSQYIGTGRRCLAIQERQQLQTMIGEELVQLGYPKANEDNSE
jgi:hypothetical protein